MAHNLNVMNGKASMVYVNELPWHGLGTRFEEKLTLSQAIEAAQADYFVKKMPLRWYEPAGGYPGSQSDQAWIYHEVAKHFATVRTDTNDTLGVVKKTYQVLQNREAFCIVDDLVGEGAAVIDTMGVLGKGERMWILCKLPDNIKLKTVNGKLDELDAYLLIVNSHDGTSGVRIALTTVRVVCQNTLHAALNNNIGQLIIRHTRNVKERVQNAHRLLSLTNETMEKVMFLMNDMMNYQLTGGGMKSFAEALFPDVQTDAKLVQEGKKPMSHIHREALYNLMFGDNLAGGTLWGAVNSVTAYVDHVLTPIVRADKRLMHNWYGSGAKLKKEAWGLAESLVCVEDYPEGDSHA